MHCKWSIAPVAGVLGLAVLCSSTPGNEKVVLRGETAQVTAAMGGGGIIEFRFLDQQTNPLNWEVGELEPEPEGDQPYLRGHFLCLDRWGPPSDAEQENGVPFHGEAPRVVWEVLQPVARRADKMVVQIGCTLPLAGMRVRRTMQLAARAPVLTVTEEVTRTRPRGRIYNMVQHPSIAPPFLDESTLVDSNAAHGFSQSGTVPQSKQEASAWPNISIAETPVDLRRFRHAAADETRHDVSSFVFDESEDFGWVTACNPSKRLLIGYLWRTRDYPWLNIWRYMRDGQVAARGLEFGTTGYHQPFPALVKTGRILGRPLFEYIDADQTVSRSYAAFLLKIPDDYLGVARVSYGEGRIAVTERRAQNPRGLTLESGSLFGD